MNDLKMLLEEAINKLDKEGGKIILGKEILNDYGITARRGIVIERYEEE